MIILIVLHVACAALWLGGAAYERFVVLAPSLRKKSQDLNLGDIRVFLRADRLLVPASVTLLLTGILLTILGGYGFFPLNWLGLKQVLMVLIAVAFLGVQGPDMARLSRLVDSEVPPREAVAALLRSLTWRFDLIHLGVVFCLVLGIVR